MKSLKRRVLATVAVTPILLSGCMIGPDYVQPEYNLPAQYVEPFNRENVANIQWWELLNDPVLQNYIRVALVQNKDLRVAATRIDAARALLGQARADQLPRIDGSGNAQRGDTGDRISELKQGPTDSYGLFADLAFDIDLWGKLRRATEAQQAQLFASEYGYRAVTISLVAQVASTYFQILGFENRLGISQRTLENRKGATKIIQARFDQGVIPELDLNQAQIEEADAAIAIYTIERNLRLAQNALSLLLGNAPFPVISGKPLVEQKINSDIPTGFPAALLERRPDILAATEAAKSAVSLVGVAEAEQLPSFSLLGFIGFQSNNTGTLLSRSAFSWNIGGNFIGPILDWGKAAYGVDFAQANAHAAYLQLEQTVNSAVKDVDDSLVAIRTYKEEQTSREYQVSAAKNAAKLSRARYDDGVSSYLEVLDIERSLFQAELGASDALQNYFISVVQLYKALGGGWDEAMANS